MKTYEIVISQTWSETYTVKARSKAEAKKKAWYKYRPKKKNYKAIVESISD